MTQLYNSTLQIFYKVKTIPLTSIYSFFNVFLLENEKKLKKFYFFIYKILKIFLQSSLVISRAFTMNKPSYIEYAPYYWNYIFFSFVSILSIPCLISFLRVFSTKFIEYF